MLVQLASELVLVKGRFSSSNLQLMVDFDIPFLFRVAQSSVPHNPTESIPQSVGSSVGQTRGQVLEENRKSMVMPL